MNYTNHASRLRLDQEPSQTPSNTPTFLSLEHGSRGPCLRVRTAATLARRKRSAFKLAVTAAIAAMSLAASARVAKAQLGYDPFAGNLSHTEENWTTYTDATTGGTNRPAATFVNGVNIALANATSFNFGVTAPSPSGAFLTSGGNIYSPTSTLTLVLTSTYVPVAGSFNAVVFSIKTLGNMIDTTAVRLTPNGGQAIAPLYSSVATSGSGMGASAQYAFQFNLSGVGGSNNFSINVPGAASSVSFSSAQLDASTTNYGTQSLVPEPSTVAAMAAGCGWLFVTFLRRRRVAA